MVLPIYVEILTVFSSRLFLHNFWSEPHNFACWIIFFGKPLFGAILDQNWGYSLPIVLIFNNGPELEKPSCTSETEFFRHLATGRVVIVEWRGVVLVP